ncbi:hypothetical protein BKM03_25300 [Pseudomonas avellanae]|uniref:Uncharacterized protein n=1 Tax=Pseudomonas avellanae TaxID=46257 RepID=A0AAD0M5S7_9PSED|nr:hypothetical protein BKM03_25300 [Pseudomonas avellanae]POP88487.1 hypothetical protein CXB34_02595 [Pseudomonas amygdali pv. morsprunorum]
MGVVKRRKSSGRLAVVSNSCVLWRVGELNAIPVGASLLAKAIVRTLEFQGLHWPLREQARSHEICVWCRKARLAAL